MKNPYVHLAGALVLLIAAVAGYLLWNGALSSKRAEAAQDAAALATLRANAALASAASEQLSSLGADAAEINAYFIDSANVVPFLETLQETGTRLGAKVDVQSVTAKNDGRPHLDLSLAISGPFAAVARTVGAIEFAPYDIKVTSLSMTASGDAGGWNAAMAFSVSTASSTPSSALSLPAAPGGAAAPSSAAHSGPAFTSVPAQKP